MAIITTTDFLNYYDGDSADGVYSSIVGYESGVTRCVRFKFVSPPTGASHVAIDGKLSPREGGAKIAPRWYITTSATSHANACGDAAYHGTLNMTNPDGIYRGYGEADILLLPNTTYYLWLFPQSATYDWWAHHESYTIETSGSVGVVYIDNGSGWDAYIPYIDNGSGWVIMS